MNGIVPKSSLCPILLWRGGEMALFCWDVLFGGIFRPGWNTACEMSVPKLGGLPWVSKKAPSISPRCGCLSQTLYADNKVEIGEVDIIHSLPFICPRCQIQRPFSNISPFRRHWFPTRHRNLQECFSWSSKLLVYLSLSSIVLILQLAIAILTPSLFTSAVVITTVSRHSP